jgi:hypothetical protein
MAMKKLLSQATVSLLVSGAVMTAFAGGPDMPSMVTPGVYMGLGGSWNTVDMSVNTGINVAGESGVYDSAVSVGNLKDSQSRLAPMAQLGYWGMIDDMWLWGLVGEYKYLNYNLNTINGSSAFVFPTGSAENSYGNLAVNLQHEFMLLLYFGATYDKGYLYLGFGPVLFTLRDSVRQYNETLGNGTFASFGSSDTIWGGAAQLGYNYYFNPTWFLGFNYTYTVSGNYSLSNNATEWYASPTATSTENLQFNRDYGFTVQEVMFSINKVFEV